MLTFMPVRTEDDIIKELIELKNKQSVLKIKENKLIDELVETNRRQIDDWLGEFINMYRNNCYKHNNMVVYLWLDLQMMDIGMIEANTVILRKTVKYLDGEIKVVVEKRIKDNYKLIDGFFDELAQEYQSIQSYEQE